MEWIIGFIKRVAANVVAFVAICIVLAAAPLISIVIVVAIERQPSLSPNLGGWFLVACPFCAGIWYMFIASMTRYARAKHFGVTPRTNFLWAGARLFFGWFAAQVAIIAVLYAGAAIVGDTSTDLYVRQMTPIMLLASWSPVLVNLTRHFLRRYPVSGISVPSPVVGQ